MRAEVDSQPEYTGIRLEGRFDHKATRDFREALIAALGQGPAELRIDLGGVEFIDSAALGMLLMAKEMAEKGGKTVTLANARGVVAKALGFANFKSIFKIA